MVKNGTPASPAVAFEIYVLPVPGGPTSRMPFGILAPRLLYLAGCFRKSTISSSSSFSSFSPATSLNVIFFKSSCLASLALDLPKAIALPPPPCCRMMNTKNATMIPIISSVGRSVSHMDSCFGGSLSSLSVPASTCGMIYDS